MKPKSITLIAMLSVIITISGFMKIPSIVPGAEFQLSAPIAVVICAVFGFRRYIVAGVIASAISFIIGAANINNIIIAMSFRVAVGLVIALLGVNIYTLIVSGPIGTALARLVLSFVLGVDYLPLMASAAFGMVVTAILSPIFYKYIIGVISKTSFREYIIFRKTSSSINKR